MDPITLAIIVMLAMFALLAIGLPIGFAMAVTGFIGSWIIRGNPTAVLSQMKSMSYDMFSSYSLSIVPMFLLTIEG